MVPTQQAAATVAAAAAVVTAAAVASAAVEGLPVEHVTLLRRREGEGERGGRLSSA